MFKKFKKIIFTLILLVTIFNFILNSNVVMASEGLNAKQIEVVNGVTNLAGGIVSILLWKERALITAIALGMNIVTAKLASSFGVVGDKAEYKQVITPFAIFFNKYYLLDINFFNIDGTGNATIKSIREGVAKWYFVLRNISAAAMVAILIYVGIRMATSTLVEDKAKYKKMLVDWCVGVAILFLLHYIIIFVIYLNNSLVKALEYAFTSMTTSRAAADSTATNKIIQDLAMNSVLSIGITSFSSLIVFVMLVFQTIMFLIAYVTRMVKVAFLIIIAPLITLTYCIDRMGDGKAQAFNIWLKEFIFTILIQPFHCIVYFAFGSVAMSLLVEGLSGGITMDKLSIGIMAVLCLKFINDAEQIVRHIFHFEDDNKGALATGAIVTMAALSNAQKLGGAARTGINGMKTNFANIRNDGTKRMNQFKNLVNNSDNPLLKGAGAGLGKMEGALNKGVDALKNNKATEALGKAFDVGRRSITGVKTEYNGFKKWVANKGRLGQWMVQHNSVSHALGNMAVLAAMASGASTMEAIGKGKAFEKAAGEFFPNSTGNIATSEADHAIAAEQQDYDNLKKKVDDTAEELGETEEEADRLGLDSDETDDGVHDAKAKSLDEEAGKLEEDASKLFTSADAQKLAGYEELIRRNGRIQGKKNNAEYKALLKKKAEAEANKLEAEALREEAAREKEKANLIRKRNGLRADLKSLSDQKDRFFDKDTVKQRMQRRRSGANKKELKSISDEITKLIIEAKLARKSKPMSMDHDEEVDEDTIDEAGKARQFIQDTLALAAKKHSEVNLDDLISRATDLDPADPVYEDLKEQMSRYFTEVKKEELATAWQRGSQYGASGGDMDDAMAERILAALQMGRIKL